MAEGNRLKSITKHLIWLYLNSKKKALLFSYDSFERREPEVSGFFSYYVMKIIYIFKNTAFNLILDDLLSILYIQI